MSVSTNIFINLAQLLAWSQILDTTVSVKKADISMCFAEIYSQLLRHRCFVTINIVCPLYFEQFIFSPPTPQYYSFKHPSMKMVRVGITLG